MKITPELLRNYSMDACTPEERRTVENWLLSAGQELPALPTDKIQQAEDLVWEKLYAGMQGVEKPSWILQPAFPIYRFAAAACLLLVAGLGFYFAENLGIGKENARYTNEKGISRKNVQVGQLALTLLPNSHAESSVSLTGTTEINFSGNVEFTNHSKREMQLTVNYLNEKSQYTSKVVRCKPGKRYVAMYTNYKVGEIFVVPWDNLHRLPPILKRRALKDFRA